MSRSEVYVGSANSQPHSELYSWLNNQDIPFDGMFKELSERRFFVPPFEGVVSRHLIEGEEISLKMLPLIGNGGYSIYLSVGDKNEAELVGLDLIPPQESPSVPNS